jgi:hypothetical protein
VRVLYARAEVTFVRESHLDEWSMLMFERSVAISPRDDTVINCGRPII